MAARILSSLLALLLAQHVSGHTYYRETVDSIETSTRERVEVLGTVLVVTMRQDKTLTFRIGDEHGHTLSCVWPPGKHDQPAVGVTMRVLGVRHTFEVPHLGRNITEIDPVESIGEP